ncbi:MAG: protein-L-isoaspartate(D-aspartate) O-methyltransferase [Bacteroidales bacterium]|nr:protein-L-isoaspartate(D-aspartate) O-methyltransferase [Bacteroidales bacterium]
MEDSLIHKALREKLIEELRTKGISDEKVLQAMLQVPRHFFCFDSALAQQAYINKAFPIESGQTISQPHTVALQSQLLEIQGNEKVLEIGTGSGYQSAILYKMGAKVYSIERQRTLYIQVKKLFQDLHYQIHTILGDGFKGMPQDAPFDRIIITAAAPFIPTELLQQLKIGGILVSPLKNGDKQEMVKLKKLSDTQFEQTLHGECTFVPMLQGISNQ